MVTRRQEREARGGRRRKEKDGTGIFLPGKALSYCSIAGTCGHVIESRNGSTIVRAKESGRCIDALRRERTIVSEC